jgi:hypothetical protein
VAPRPPKDASMDETRQGAGWVTFAGIMVLMVGVLNVIWGIAAIDNANFFVGNERFIFSDLNTWGWIILIIGVLQVFAAFSIWAGGGFGVFIGIVTATVGAVGALLSIPAYPLWSLAIFAVDILIIYGLSAYGGQRSPA